MRRGAPVWGQCLWWAAITPARFSGSRLTVHLLEQVTAVRWAGSPPLWTGPCQMAPRLQPCHVTLRSPTLQAPGLLAVGRDLSPMALTLGGTEAQGGSRETPQPPRLSRLAVALPRLVLAGRAISQLSTSTQCPGGPWVWSYSVFLKLVSSSSGLLAADLM